MIYQLQYPPEIIPPYAATKAADLPAYTSSNWTGTGPQIDSSSDGYSLPTDADNLFVSKSWTILNLRPKEYTGACELWTPFLTNHVYDGLTGGAVNNTNTTTEIYPNNEVEFFWNPQRKTYQTAVPDHNYSYTSGGSSMSVSASSQEIAWAYNQEVMSNIKWKFQPPTKLYLGTSSGIIGKYAVGGDIEDASFSVQNDSMFRMPVYDYNDMMWLVRYLVGGNRASFSFPSIEAQTLTVLRMCVSNFKITGSTVTSLVNLANGLIPIAEYDKYL